MATDYGVSDRFGGRSWRNGSVRVREVRRLPSRVAAVVAHSRRELILDVVAGLTLFGLVVLMLLTIAAYE